MKKYLFLFLFTILTACNNHNKEEKEFKKSINKESVSPSIAKTKFGNKSIYDLKFITIKNVLINDHRVILSKVEFESIYTHIDSTKTRIWECGSPFDWIDREWMTKTYGEENRETGVFSKFNGEITTIYSKNIEFATNNHIVLFDTGFADNNSFKIISHNIILNKNTTLNEFRSKFPNSKMETTENPNEVRFRFYLKELNDDAFLFYFKDGKLNYFTLWWLLC
ncbi:hypothetical protein [Flavobacterium sp. FlaQc-47]|uniref:hypothetical protein n=1 Tax=Flavobacterium sp. FlaQc-47 TaxID=3374180 RepID=UPI003756B036